MNALLLLPPAVQNLASNAFVAVFPGQVQQTVAQAQCIAQHLRSVFSVYAPCAQPHLWQTNNRDTDISYYNEHQERASCANSVCTAGIGMPLRSLSIDWPIKQ